MHSGYQIPGIHYHHSQENTHFHGQIPTTQLDPHHYLLPPYYAAASPAYTAVNFKLGLNEMNECYEMPHTRQTPFWEPHPVESSNEIEDKQENITMKTCLDTTNTPLHFGELEEAIYNRTSTQPKKKKKKKKRDDVMEVTAEYLGKVVEKVMDHQESMQRKLMEVVERLDGERSEREAKWRIQELEHYQRQAQARLQDKALVMSREDVILSYLEKITGHTITFPPL